MADHEQLASYPFLTPARLLLGHPFNQDGQASVDRWTIILVRVCPCLDISFRRQRGSVPGCDHRYELFCPFLGGIPDQRDSSFKHLPVLARGEVG